jgi:hypothetical protein
MTKVAYTKEYDLIVRVIHLSKKQEFQQATDKIGFSLSKNKSISGGVCGESFQ